MEPEMIKSMINYQEGAIVSKEILKTAAGTVTVFAFDAGQGLSEHTAPFEGLIVIVDGQAKITVSGQSSSVNEGQMIKLPANETHAVYAQEKFKMLLVMMKK